MKLEDTTLGWRFINQRMQETYGVDTMSQTAENVAERYGISRADQDAFALRSQQRAGASADLLAEEIMSVCIPQKRGEPLLVKSDEQPRPDSTAEGLARLKPVVYPS